MGGWGSGRQEKTNRKKTTGDEYSVNVLAWHRMGHLTAGNSFECGHGWFERDLIAGLLSGPALRVFVFGNYDEGEDNEGEDNEEEDNENGSFHAADSFDIEYVKMQGRGEVALEWTPCNFGGVRPWLVCRGCQTRRTKLYHTLLETLSSPGFRCRVCLGLAFESQRQDSSRRLAVRAKRGRRKVGGFLAPGLTAPFPARPKGMHHATYERLRAESMDAEQRWVLSENVNIARVSEVLQRSRRAEQ